MKAAVCREFGKPWTIEDIQLAPPGPREIRVKIKACAICHSDISYADGIWGGELPAVSVMRLQERFWKQGIKLPNSASVTRSSSPS